MGLDFAKIQPAGVCGCILVIAKIVNCYLLKVEIL